MMWSVSIRVLPCLTCLEVELVDLDGRLRCHEDPAYVPYNVLLLESLVVASYTSVRADACWAIVSTFETDGNLTENVDVDDQSFQWLILVDAFHKIRDPTTTHAILRRSDRFLLLLKLLCHPKASPCPGRPRGAQFFHHRQIAMFTHLVIVHVFGLCIGRHSESSSDKVPSFGGHAFFMSRTLSNPICVAVSDRTALATREMSGLVRSIVDVAMRKT